MASSGPVVSEDDRFDVFISFAAADRHQAQFGRSVDIVAEIKRTLERYRHPDTARRLRVCTYDEDFELDAEIRGAIASHLDRSTAVLFLGTGNAAKSEYVALELALATQRGAEHPLLGAIVDVEPAGVFPAVFTTGGHAADFSYAGCTNRRAWRRRIEMETAKIAARIWNVPLRRIRDRFVTDQRRQNVWRWSAIAVAAGLIAASLAGLREYRRREDARVLGVHQRYAADMSAVQRAWTDGEVDQTMALLRRYESADDPDPRSFDWFTYGVVATAERFAFGEFGQSVKALTVSPAGPVVAFSARDTPTMLFDAVSGKRLATLSAATSDARSLTFTSDGSQLVGIAGDGLFVWDSRERKEIAVAHPSHGRFLGSACHPVRPRCIAVDTAGTTYSLADRGLSVLTRNLLPRQESLRVAFSPGGEALAILSDTAMYILEGSGSGLRHVTNLDGVRSESDFAVGNDRAYVITGDHVTTIGLAGGKAEPSPRLGNGVALAGVAVDRSGRLIAVGDPSDQSVVIREIDEWRELGSVKGYRGWLSAVSFIPGTTRIVGGTLGGDVKVWDLARIGSRTVREQPGTIVSMIFLPGTKDLLSLDGFGWLRRWNVETLEERWKLRIAERAYFSSLSMYGGDVALKDDNGNIRLLKASDGAELRRFAGTGPLATAAHDSIFAYTHHERNVIIVGPVKGSVKHEIPVSGEETSMAMTAGGQSILVASSEGRVQHFDVATKRVLFDIQAHSEGIRHLVISPDERQFATASSDQTVALWDLTTGRPLARLSGHTDTVAAVAFSPDGKTLVSGGHDGLIRIWNVPSALPTIRFFAHARDLSPGVTALTFSRDGKYLVSGGSLGTIVRWDAGEAR